MGYESKIYAVRKTDVVHPEIEKIYAEPIIILDLSKAGGIGSVFNTPTDCYFYADDENTKVVKDKYGKPLMEGNIQDVINWLEKALTRSEYYRFKIALETLYILKRFDDITLLHYGY